MLVVQGTNDLRVNPVNGDQVIQQWLDTNRLATGGMFTADFATPTTDTRFNEATPGGHPYRVRTWTDNHGKIVHEYWTIDGMGHAWSGGYWLGSFADPRGPTPPGPCTPSSPSPDSPDAARGRDHLPATTTPHREHGPGPTEPLRRLAARHAAGLTLIA